MKIIQSKGLFSMIGEEVKPYVIDVEKVSEKYRKALEEIREMAIYDCQRECSNNSENCTIGSCLEQRIQRKINEVLQDENNSK